MSKYRYSAVAAAALLGTGLATGSASAADFGGDCCADLEERIAELEATTARKGNRKVSLTVSGFVAQQIMAWDDGQQSDIYITDTGSVSIGTNFSFTGQAKITPDLSAGFALKIEVMNNDSLGVSQTNDDGGNVFGGVVQNGGAFAIESAYWFLKSKSLGRLSVGQQSSAADNQAIIVDGSGSLVQANYVLYDVRSFGTRLNGNFTGFTWGALADCKTVGGGTVNSDCDGYPNNNIRYDTPVFAGFSASASWGENDIWAVSGRYAGKLANFSVAAAIAYVHSSDETSVIPATQTGARANGGLDAAAMQAGLYIEHNPTGLFAYGAYGEEYVETTGAVRGLGKTDPEGSQWYVKAGIKGKWTPLGTTTLFGNYGVNDDKMSNEIWTLYDDGVDTSELTQYGAGVVQTIDAAAMSVWLTWKHYDAEVTCGTQGVNNCAAQGLNTGVNDLDDIDIVKAGALIAF